MWRLRRFFAKLWNLFRQSRIEQEVAREIACHMALMEEEFERRGMTPLEARWAAKREYGGIEQVKELHREARSFVWLEQALQDVRYACRNLARSPGFTVVIVLTLTLGIGANATLFSAYNAVALKPLPVADPDEVVRLERWFQHGYRGDIQYAFSYPEYTYCRDHNDVFSSVVAASWTHQVLVERAVGTGASRPESAAAQLVSANYFADLGVIPRMGRSFNSDVDAIAGANAVAVISYPFWQKRFQADPRVLGSILKVNGTALTVIGIAPEKFTGTSTLPQVPDLWVPLSLQPQFLPGSDWLHAPENPQVQILGRLNGPTSFKRAQAEADALIRQFAKTFNPAEKTMATTLQHTAFFGNTDDIRFKAFVAALMLLVGSVLLVACVNVANMLLARGAARRNEIGMRLALGASRGRVIRQLLTESVLLALVGGAGGLVASRWTTNLLWVSVQQIFSGLFPGTAVFSLDLSPDIRVFGYALALSLITGVLFGLSPALQFSRADATLAVRDEGAPLGWREGRSRVRGLLVATQVAVSMVLLISTGLLLRGLVRSQSADPGFETQKTLLIAADFGSDETRSLVLERRVLDRLQTLPGVKGAALGTTPFLGTWTPAIVIEGRDVNGEHRTAQTSPSDRTLASYASGTYFETLGIPIVSGRGFTDREARANAHVAVISESTARRFWAGEDPLGKLFKLDLDFRGEFTEFQVVGVARDVRFANLTRMDPTHVYVPTGTKGSYGILIRSEGDPELAMASVRVAVRGLDRSLLPSLWLSTIDKGPLHLQKSLAQTWATYAGMLAFLALTLAGVGMYGVMAYLVSQRIPEIGIRMALGATTTHVLKAIVMEGLWPIFVGMAAGMAGAAAISWSVHASLAFPGSADFFYGIPFYDPATFLGLSGFFAIITAAAIFVPAKRATGVDPLVALRCN